MAYLRQRYSFHFIVIFGLIEINRVDKLHLTQKGAVICVFFTKIDSFYKENQTIQNQTKTIKNE